VDVILGPLLAHTTVAVGEYLAPLGVPHVSYSVGDDAESKTTFYPAGSSRGDSYPSGLFAYDELGARTAAIIHQDYLYGEQVRDGFTAAFTTRGGTIISVQKVPFGTVDMAPYIEGMGEPDVICLLLVSPSDVAFMRQYHEFGLKMPAIFGHNFPQGEIYKLDEVGDPILGFYGCSTYSPLIDTPANKEFIQKFEEKYGFWPGVTTVVSYVTTTMFLEAVRSTSGDTSHAKIIKALEGIKDLQTPFGTATMQNRVAVLDEYVFKAVKMGDKVRWQPVKKYPNVQPM